MGFWLRYLATAIVGTLVIYYGLPSIKPGRPAVLRQSLLGKPADVAANRIAPVQVRGASLSPETAPLADPPTQAMGSAEETASSNAVEGAPQQASLPPPDASAEPPPVVITERNYTPSTQRIRPSGDDTTHWGVTILDASHFEKDGKRREGNLPGGVLVEQITTTTSSKREFALCRVWRGQEWEGPYLIATADLVRFEGGRGEVDAEALDALCRYYSLNARLEARKSNLVRLAVDANPHAAPLRSLKQGYDEAAARAKQLTQMRDNASGAERIRIGDELRRLKETEPVLRKNLEALTQQYEQWKQSHSTAGVGPAQDSQIQALEVQMKALLPRLHVFGL
jgi:hypothetical protein